MACVTFFQESHPNRKKKTPVNHNRNNYLFFKAEKQPKITSLGEVVILHIQILRNGILGTPKQHFIFLPQSQTLP